jgi:hypothetical protein
MKINSNQNRGFIKLIIIIIIAIAVLAYFGINLNNIWNFIVHVWNNYLAVPFIYVWNLWVTYVWTPFMNSINSLNN